MAFVGMDGSGMKKPGLGDPSWTTGITMVPTESVRSSAPRVCKSQTQNSKGPRTPQTPKRSNIDCTGPVPLLVQS